MSKEELSDACSYKKLDEVQKIPWYENSSNKANYKPSSCLQPKEYDSALPVIINGTHFNNEHSRIFCPMYWSLIPSWHKVLLNNNVSC